MSTTDEEKERKEFYDEVTIPYFTSDRLRQEVIDRFFIFTEKLLPSVPKNSRIISIDLFKLILLELVNDIVRITVKSMRYSARYELGFVPGYSNLAETWSAKRSEEQNMIDLYVNEQYNAAFDPGSPEVVEDTEARKAFWALIVRTAYKTEVVLDTSKVAIAAARAYPAARTLTIAEASAGALGYAYLLQELRASVKTQIEVVTETTQQLNECIGMQAHLVSQMLRWLDNEGERIKENGLKTSDSSPRYRRNFRSRA